MFTGLIKWTQDNIAAETINEACLPMKFPELRKMSNTQVRTMSHKHIYSFVTVDLAYDRHKDTMKKIDDTNEIAEFNENIACDDEFLVCTEWLLIAYTACVTDVDEDLEAKILLDTTYIPLIDAGELGAFRFDTLVATSFIEFACPVKHGAHIVDRGLK